MMRRLFFLDHFGKKKKKSLGRSPQNERPIGDITSESESASLEAADEKNSKLLSSSPMQMKDLTTSDSDKFLTSSSSSDKDSNDS